MKGALKVGKVAQLAHVNIETIRYYERQGLIPPPPRRESGYRNYPKETVDIVNFIKRAQEVGFSLKEIANLISLRTGSDTTCGDIKRLSESKILEIEGKIQSLNRMKDELVKLVSECQENRQVHECPVLLAFGEEREGITIGNHAQTCRACPK